MWIIEIGKERIEETIDLKLTIERVLEIYLKKGYGNERINQRLPTIQVIKELTDMWNSYVVKKGVEWTIFTNEIAKAWSGMTTRQYKNLKVLKGEFER